MKYITAAGFIQCNANVFVLHVSIGGYYGSITCQKEFRWPIISQYICSVYRERRENRIASGCTRGVQSFNYRAQSAVCILLYGRIMRQQVVHASAVHHYIVAGCVGMQMKLRETVSGRVVCTFHTGPSKQKPVKIKASSCEWKCYTFME